MAEDSAAGASAAAAALAGAPVEESQGQGSVVIEDASDSSESDSDGELLAQDMVSLSFDALGRDEETELGGSVTLDVDEEATPEDSSSKDPSPPVADAAAVTSAAEEEQEEEEEEVKNEEKPSTNPTGHPPADDSAQQQQQQQNLATELSEARRELDALREENQRLLKDNDRLESDVLFHQKRYELGLQQAARDTDAKLAKLRAKFDVVSSKRKEAFLKLQQGLRLKTGQVNTLRAQLMGSTQQSQAGARAAEMAAEKTRKLKADVHKHRQEKKKAKKELEKQTKAWEKSKAALDKQADGLRAQIEAEKERVAQAEKRLAAQAEAESRRNKARCVITTPKEGQTPTNGLIVTAAGSFEAWEEEDEEHTVQWYRSFGGSFFTKVEGLLGRQKQYRLSVDDIGATMRAVATNRLRVQCAAEIGPVCPHAGMMTKLGEHVKKMDVDLPVMAATGGGNGKASPKDKKHSKRSIHLTKDKVKIRSGGKTVQKDVYGSELKAFPDPGSTQHKVILQLNDKGISFSYLLPSALERDLVVMTVRAFNKLAPLPKSERPAEHVQALYELVRALNVGDSESHDSRQLARQRKLEEGQTKASKLSSPKPPPESSRPPSRRPSTATPLSPSAGMRGGMGSPSLKGVSTLKEEEGGADSDDGGDGYTWSATGGGGRHKSSKSVSRSKSKSVVQTPTQPQQKREIKRDAEGFIIQEDIAPPGPGAVGQKSSLDVFTSSDEDEDDGKPAFEVRISDKKRAAPTADQLRLSFPGPGGASGGGGAGLKSPGDKGQPGTKKLSRREQAAERERKAQKRAAKKAAKLKAKAGKGTEDAAAAAAAAGPEQLAPVVAIDADATPPVTPAPQSDGNTLAQPKAPAHSRTPSGKLSPPATPSPRQTKGKLPPPPRFSSKTLGRIEGALSLRGQPGLLGTRPAWTTRFFKLKGNHLKWYATQAQMQADDGDSKALGSLDVAGAEVMREQADPNSKQKGGQWFSVTEAGGAMQSLMLAAADEEERTQWFMHISMASVKGAQQEPAASKDQEQQQVEEAAGAAEDGSGGGGGVANTGLQGGDGKADESSVTQEAVGSPGQPEDAAKDDADDDGFGAFGSDDAFANAFGGDANANEKDKEKDKVEQQQQENKEEGQEKVQQPAPSTPKDDDGFGDGFDDFAGADFAAAFGDSNAAATGDSHPPQAAEAAAAAASEEPKQEQQQQQPPKDVEPKPEEETEEEEEEEVARPPRRQRTLEEAEVEAMITGQVGDPEDSIFGSLLGALGGAAEDAPLEALGELGLATPSMPFTPSKAKEAATEPNTPAAAATTAAEPKPSNSQDLQQQQQLSTPVTAKQGPEVVAVVTETVHAKLGADGSVQAFAVAGEVSLTLPGGAIPAGDGPCVVCMRVSDVGSATQLQPNPACVVTPAKGVYECTVKPSQAVLKVLAYKTTLGVAEAAAHVPLKLKAAWECSESATSVSVDYATVTQNVLRDAKFLFTLGPAGAVTACEEATPKCMWNHKSQKVMWRFPQMQDSRGKLFARFATSSALSPSPLVVSFVCNDPPALPSGLALVECASSDASSAALSKGRLTAVRRQIKSGHFTVQAGGN